MQSTITWLIGMGLLFCCVNCKSEREASPIQEPRVVHVPHRIWPGCKAAPEMDAVFQDLHPGQEVKLKLIFASRKNNLVTSKVFKIKRGSIYFYSEAGYFRLGSDGKVYSAPDGQQEVLLDTSYWGINIDYNSVFNTSASGPDLDLKYKIQPIASEEINGKFISYIVVRLSEDFEGEIVGWQSCHGI